MLKAILLATAAAMLAAPAFAQCPTDGNFTVSGGQVIGPNGVPFSARGVNIYADTLTGLDPTTIAKTFPGINFIRVNVFDMQSAVSSDAFTKMILQLNSMGIVTEIEDHNYPTVLSGGDLTAAEQVYSALASEFKGDGLVIFGTQNEPSAGDGSIDDEISGIYNAIRSTGNKTLILINPYGGYSTNSLSPSTFASMTNVAWDLHYYNWIANNSTSVSDNRAALLNEIASVSSIRDADGVIPVIIGEYGNAAAQTMDPGGTAVVQAVNLIGIGSVAWAWESGNSSDGGPVIPADLVYPPWAGGPSSLTPFGQMVAQNIAATGQSASCPPGQPNVQPVVDSMTVKQAAPILAGLNAQTAAAQAQLAAATAANPAATTPPAAVRAPGPAAPTSAATFSPIVTSSAPVAMPVPVLPTVAAPAGPSPTASMAVAMPSMIAAPALPPAEDAGMTPAQAEQLTEAQQQVNTIATELAAAQAQLAAERQQLTDLSAAAAQ